MNAQPSPGDVIWSDLVRRVRAGEPAAMEDLYRVFHAGVRFTLWRQIGAQDMPDRLHDVFLIVTESIRSGELREPERLMGYVRTIVRRQVAGHLLSRREQRLRWRPLDFGRGLPDRVPGPEHGLIRRQHRELVSRLLIRMRPRDREVLVRFYVQEQPADDICREMELTETQFRLLKSRAKATLTRLCHGMLGG